MENHAVAGIKGIELFIIINIFANCMRQMITVDYRLIYVNMIRLGI